MRFLTTSMMALMVAIAITGCSGSSSSSSDNSTSAATDNSAASSSSDNTSSSSDNSGAMSSSDNSSSSGASGGEPPNYPGAKTEAAGSNAMGGSGSASGKVLSTGDSFDKVYAWYQKNMPSGSEKSHTDSPVKSAVFTVGDPGNQESVTITTANGKTMITVAHVKM